MVIRINSIRIQVDSPLDDGFLEPLLEGDAILDQVTDIPMVWAVQRIVSHAYLVWPTWFRKAERLIVHQLLEHSFHQLPPEDVLLLEEV